MAAFTHVGLPSRFSRGKYGVYYASDRIEGALCEAAHHQEIFLRRTFEPNTHVQMRTYIGRIACKLHDVRGGWPEIHDRDSYLQAQQLGGKVRTLGGNGIVFNSVRLPVASNIAVFRPKVLAAPAGKPHVIQGPHLTVEWDGARISRYILMGDPGWKPLPAA
jgi:RES domain